MTFGFKYVIAIDPGTTQSGVCIVRAEDYKPMFCTKTDNKDVLGAILSHIYENDWTLDNKDVRVVMERMQGNNMPVSSDVFLTCEWIGRFDVFLQTVFKGVTEYVFRRDEYKKICANIYTHNDKGVRSSLVDRFAYGEKNYGKGTKAAPGWFYGFSQDSWSAYAVAVTYLDMKGGF